jgi:hypothetical protein
LNLKDLKPGEPLHLRQNLLGGLRFLLFFFKLPTAIA